MDFLSKGDAPFTDELWSRLQDAVIGAARETLVGRRFLPLYGPLGPGAVYAPIDQPNRQEVLEDGFGSFQNRQVAQIPQLYEDFWIYWRDLAYTEKEGLPLDVSAARGAAVNLTLREDKMIFYGVKALGIDGLLTAKGVNTQKRSDWAAGEDAFGDVSTAIATLLQKGKSGRHTLVVSQDLYVQLQRIQPGTGTLESERVEKLVDGRLYHSVALEPKTALVVSAQPQYMDLVVGQDIDVAYTEAVDLNHHLRVMETALPRVKDPAAIVVLK